MIHVQLQVVRADVVDDGVGMVIGDPAGRVVDVHDRIDHGAGIRRRVLDHIADGVGRRVEERLDLGLHRHIDGIVGHESLLSVQV
jgi:hypothetical protein